MRAFVNMNIDRVKIFQDSSKTAIKVKSYLLAILFSCDQAQLQPSKRSAELPGICDWEGGLEARING